MRQKKLKIWNGRGNNCEGHLYIAAFSRNDARDLVNAAYRKEKGYEDRSDIAPYSLGEIKNYWHPDCWGNAMDGIVRERGVWLLDDGSKVPRRIL